MWRIGATFVLLLGLVVLVVDMLFGAHEPAARAAREVAPPNWSATTEPAQRLPGAVGLTPAAAPAIEPRRGSADGILADDAVGTADARPAADRIAPHEENIPLLNEEMLARLPAAPGAATDVQPLYEISPAYDYGAPSPTLGRPQARPYGLPRAEPPAETRATTGLPSEQRDLPAPKPRIIDPNTGAGTGAGTGAASASGAKAGTASGGADAADPAIASAQRRLAMLGYSPGPADGRPGPRTDAAVREFQADLRLRVDGTIDEALLARLEAASKARARLRQQELDAMSPGTPGRTPPPQERDVFASVLGGVQRLIGRDFNSRLRPAEITSYCRANADSWIYDFGREAFVFCGNIIAGQGSRVVAPTIQDQETAATP